MTAKDARSCTASMASCKRDAKPYRRGPVRDDGGDYERYEIYRYDRGTVGAAKESIL